MVATGGHPQPVIRTPPPHRSLVTPSVPSCFPPAYRPWQGFFVELRTSIHLCYFVSITCQYQLSVFPRK
ncbi:hypothetical protein E2C01_047095 [Portunus trituberculatus]|uniref:Uncharacterized protein n=1 Tax=Portunus trituberculatus TaxID=210409 RepID=A0A5B7G6L7_PORTR|nr:hypothetical protein [Portunus trituberculatus]